MSLESELTGVMIADCFVYGWQQVDDMLIFEIDASLWPANPNYEKPKAGEWTCYKRSELTFHGVREVVGLLSMQQVHSTTDPDKTADYGSIDAITEISGGFTIAGNFGNVTVMAEGLQLKVSPQT